MRSLTRCTLMQRLWGRQGKDALLSYVRQRDEVRLSEILRTAAALQGELVSRHVHGASTDGTLSYVHTARFALPAAVSISEPVA